MNFRSLYLHWCFLGDHVSEAGDVPIGSPHAAMAGEGADAVWIIGAVNADAWLAEADPADSDWVIGAARKHVEFAGTDAAIKHSFVPPECGHGRDAENPPFSRWSRMGAGTGGNRDARDQRITFIEVEDGVFAGDDDASIGKLRLLREVPCGRHVFDFKRRDVWNADFFSGFEAVELFAGIELHEELDGAMVALAEEFAVCGVGEVFDLGLLGWLGCEVADEF